MIPVVLMDLILPYAAGLALGAEEFAGREHPQFINRLAEQVAEIAAIEREQYVGTSRAVMRTGLSLATSKSRGQSKINSSFSMVICSRSAAHAREASAGLSARLSRTSRRTHGDTRSCQGCRGARSKTCRDAPAADKLAAKTTLLSRKIFNGSAGTALRPLHPQRAWRRVLRPNRRATLLGGALFSIGWRGNGATVPFHRMKGNP